MKKSQPELPPDLLHQFMEQGVPFNRWMGLRLIESHPGEMIIHMPFREDMVGDPFRPALHGGVVAALLDAIGGGAVFTQLGVHDRASTVDLRVDYLKPGECKDVFSRGKVLRMGNRVATAQMTCWHEGEENDPFATAIGVYNVRRGHSRE